MRASEPGQSLLLMLDVADRLAAHKIPYAMIGAIAAAVHGVVRASLDADAIVSLPLSGFSLRVVEPEDLIAMKLFAAGPRDLADAREVFAAKRAALDLELLRRLVLRFGRGTAERLEKLRAEPP